MATRPSLSKQLFDNKDLPLDHENTDAQNRCCLDTEEQML